MFRDIALVYDRDARRCDLALGEDGDLVLDETPITPILLSIGLDRRAAVDDPLPESVSEFLTRPGLSARRGAPGDALDPEGRLTGSRLWLLDRAKHTETTRLFFAMWLAEALAWAETETGTPATIAVEWKRPGVLGYRVLVDDSGVAQTVGA